MAGDQGGVQLDCDSVKGAFHINGKKAQIFSLPMAIVDMCDDVWSLELKRFLNWGVE